jgi:hypothetical protein
MKCLYLALMSLDPTGTGRQCWTNRWLSRHAGAVLVLLPVRFPVPLAEPGVRRRTGLSTVSPVRLASPRGGDRAADMTWHYPA